MSDLEKAEQIAERLRQEPYHLFRNDCLIKSVRLKRKCAALGIKARVTVCIGRAQARFFGHWLTVPVIHAWAEVENKRIETSRPLGSAGIRGIVPVNIKPIIAVRF